MLIVLLRVIFKILDYLDLTEIRSVQSQLDNTEQLVCIYK